MGPTASGKSEVAMILAERTGAEIVSVDSMQVYRDMDIGTAKPTAEERRCVAHHMIDLVDPADPYSVAEFQADGRSVLARLTEAGVPALIVGGSGLHFRALVDPLDFPASDPEVRARIDTAGDAANVAALVEADPEAGMQVDLANPRRVARALEVLALTGETPSARAATAEAGAVREYRPLMPFAAAIVDPGDAMAARVEARFDAMMDAGFLDEVAALASRLGRTAAQAAGYRQLLPVVAGEWTIEEGRRRAVDATRSLAGRQRTFFGKDPRLVPVEWHDDPLKRADRVQSALEDAGWIS